MKFPCTRCGACCMDISMVPEMEEFALPSGRCRYLGNDNRTCSIYHVRPVLCRVDDLGRLLRLGPTFHEMMKEACKKLHLKVYGVEQEPHGETCQHEVKR